MTVLVEAMNKWWEERSSPVASIRVSKTKEEIWEAYVETKPHLKAQGMNPIEAIDAVQKLLESEETPYA